MRGGTSKGVFFHARDLPVDLAERNEIFCAAIGSPDPYGRQLDGMGGGISSLSKVVVIEPSDRPGIDVDYTFGQVVVDAREVDYGATCGNLSSAVGPFAVDEGLLDIADGEAVVRVHNTNTDKVFESRFVVRNGQAVTTGGFTIPGVAGNGARVQLDYLDPAGARTGALLPTERLRDQVTLADGRIIKVCCVDATTPCVFVAAADLGLSATELPGDLEAMGEVLANLENIRAQAGVLMGLGDSPAAITKTSRASPRVAVVAPPMDMTLLDGTTLIADNMDIAVRMISMGQPHRAVPLTGGMCLAAAAKLSGSLVHGLCRPDMGDDIRLGTPSGAIPIGAVVRNVVQSDSANFTVERITTYRTARRLMEGNVLLPT
jgi:2-methylaconitate cis-trans-isomerase PrpF